MMLLPPMGRWAAAAGGAGRQAMKRGEDISLLMAAEGKAAESREMEGEGAMPLQQMQRRVTPHPPRGRLPPTTQLRQ